MCSAPTAPRVVVKIRATVQYDGVLGGFTVAWCDAPTPPDDSQTPSVKPQVPLTLHEYCALLCYLIFLRIWSSGDSSSLGEVSLGWV